MKTNRSMPPSAVIPELEDWGGTSVDLG